MTEDGIPPGEVPPGETAWDGDAYHRRFADLAATGVDVHGEADCVTRLGPASVLDAGCGTGRVAAELARRGIDVVGIDRDASMIATARTLAPTVEEYDDACRAAGLELVERWSTWDGDPYAADGDYAVSLHRRAA